MPRSIAALALLVVLLGTAALPASVAAGQHTVRGFGKDSQGQEFRLRADGTPSQAAGRVLFGFGVAGPQRGTVDCLWVEGRRAALTGTLDAPVGGSSSFKLVVKDDPKDTRRPRDLFYVSLSSAPVDCSTAYQLLPQTVRIVRGNIKVD